jgi:hypothetical protein
VNSDEDKPAGALFPTAITAFLAALGVAGMAFLFVSADQVPESRGVGMQSATAAYRAGATITPTASGSPRPQRSIMIADEWRQDP